MLRWAGQSRDDPPDGGAGGARPSRLQRLRGRLGGGGAAAGDDKSAGPSRISRAVGLLRRYRADYEDAAPKQHGAKGDPGDHPFIKVGRVMAKAAKTRASRVSIRPTRRGSGGLSSADSAEDLDPEAVSLSRARRASFFDDVALDLNNDVQEKQREAPRSAHLAEEDEDGGHINWYDHPLGVRTGGDSDVSQEEAVRLVAKLGNTLKRVHPKFQAAEDLVPEAELKEQIAALMPKTLRLNAALTVGELPSAFIGDGLRQAPPRLVVVTGHSGDGGNVGLNGVYERHPDTYCRRPIYQKFLEKQSGTEDLEADEMGWTRRHFERSPAPTIGRSRKIAANQTKVTVRAPRGSEPMSETVNVAREAWFLYFVESQQRWCIGPRVGSREVYARCPALERLLPDHLVGWEVWDVGAKTWRPQKRMQAVKGGN